MRLLNFNEKENNIHHFCGGSEKHFNLMRAEFDTIKNNKLVLPENLSIITVFTDRQKAILVDQLELNNIPYVNASKVVDSSIKFKNDKKIQLISDELKNIKTDYCLVLDAYDVIIYSFNNIIERFLSTGCDILFNACKAPWPNNKIEHIPYNVGRFCHFNSGCIIGYTKEIKSFYDECAKLYYAYVEENTKNSDQFVMRQIYKDYSDDILKEYSKMKINYDCYIFTTFSCIKLKETGNEDFHIAY